MKWHVDKLGEFYECGEPSQVYFDPSSGGTHLLGEFAAYVIKQLSLNPVTTCELVEKISPDVDSMDRTEIVRALPALLDHLTSLEIVSTIEF